MKRAFTIMEILTVLAIILIVAALTYPVLKSAKQSAQRDVTIQRFHQIYIAMSIYRTDNDGAGNFGDYAKMGLPPNANLLIGPKLLPTDIFHSGCPSVFPTPPGAIFQQMWHADPEPATEPWTAYSLQFRSNAILMGDQNCDFAPENFGNPMVRHRAIGLYEDGHALAVMGFGSPALYAFWNP